MTDYHVITFYSIEQIEDHKKLGRVVERFCVKNKIVGTFFSTPQGVNTTLSGPKQSLIDLISLLENKFKLKLKDQTWSISSSVPFKRLKIKCRDKLLPLEGNFDPVLSRGIHLDPSEWNKLILDPETVVLDVRNDYETKIGSFKNSTIPNMKNFTDFPAFVDSNLSNLKEKKIAMFCTGGIRCEIASSFMLEEGFEQVYQLDSGVLGYLKEVEQEENLWEGECFVFDERVTVNENLERGEYFQCFGCRRPLSKIDLQSKHYIKGVSCHLCYLSSSDEDKERFAQRQKQIDLAEARGHEHMGKNAKQKNNKYV
ncbi:MAG: rhodanese-related sulfurtransferase [SAR86 cluster bacterium]|nr:rhodanese-related sulfurtransferase [SAR86 cluster bacterium]